MTQRPTIRFASADEGPVVRDILMSQNVTLGHIADWSGKLGPFWLLALYGDEAVGCINVNYGEPVGRAEFLTVRPDVPRKEYALTCRDLSYAAMAVLKKNGSQLMAFYIADHDKQWRQISERRGCVPMENGTFMMKRL